ncbi:MAG: preprotein translocase subunit YajC [Alphaproteobacteria bacterium]|nr:preprotein translocase subunit YajC [Alphaproteobacteria bacterium]
MLDLFVSTGWAQTATASGVTTDWSVMLVSYLPIVFIFAIFYLLIIRPQNQAAKAHADLVKNLKKGDVVLIDGGLVGEVTKLMDQLAHLKVNAEDEVCVARASVKKVLGAEESKGWEPMVHGKSKK